MTIRPIPLQKREWSARTRATPIDLVEPPSTPLTLSRSRPQSAISRGSRPQSAMTARIPISGIANYSRQQQSLSEIYHHPLMRGTSAAMKPQSYKRNLGGSGMRLIPLNQPALLNEMVYGTSIGNRGHTTTWDSQPSRPGTAIGKRLPPLRTPQPTDDSYISYRSTSQQAQMHKGPAAQVNRHVIFDQEDTRVSVTRPYSARKQMTTLNIRAKSARPVREDLVCFFAYFCRWLRDLRTRD
jgi:hypothetical protein